MVATTLSLQEAAQLSYELMRQIPRDAAGNPLTLEGCVRSILLKSPNLCAYRDDALGILYCVLGAGIGWHEGRLVDCTPNNYMNMPPQVGGQGIWASDFGLEESCEIMGVSAVVRQLLCRGEESRQARAIQVVMDIDRRCQVYGPEPSWYPISWYACNLCVPREAQADFVAGAIETCQCILATTPQPGTQRWIVHQRTKGYAEEILLVLQARGANPFVTR